MFLFPLPANACRHPFLQLSRGCPSREGGSRPLSIKSLTEKCGSVFIWKCTGLQREALIHRNMSLLFLESFHIPLILMPIQFPENETRISLYDGISKLGFFAFHHVLEVDLISWDYYGIRCLYPREERHTSL